MNTRTETLTKPRRLRRPGRVGRILAAIGIAVVLVVAPYGVSAYLNSLSGLGEPTLVVYTYSSLFGGANCYSPVFSTVFGEFASTHHVRIVVECPSGTLVSTLRAQANAPAADLVIGLDELTAPLAEQYHLLIPYAPPALANVSPALVAQISPSFGVVPYEYGYLAIDYNSSFAQATHGAISRATFPDFATNHSWAQQLLVENPSTDITGQEFLAWQILYYQDVLHQSWTGFWNATIPWLPPPAPDWGSAFGEFTTPPGNPQLVVSYSLDPAYAAANGQAGQYNSTVAWWNGTAYGWRTIYGIGIVNGTRHLSLDQEFENWFLSGPVQSQIPTNEWEYPANVTIPLPQVFSAAIPPSSIVALNNDTSPAQLAQAVPGWVNTWLALYVARS